MNSVKKWSWSSARCCKMKLPLLLQVLYFWQREFPHRLVEKVQVHLLPYFAIGEKKCKL